MKLVVKHARTHEHAEISYPYNKSWLLASLGLIQEQQAICSPGSLLLLVSSPRGSWLCMQGTGTCWQWQLSQGKAELRLSQEGVMERGHPSIQLCTSCPRHGRNRLSANTPLLARDPLGVYLEHSASVEHQGRYLLQPNRPCTRCSERHQHQPQEHAVLSARCSFHYINCPLFKTTNITSCCRQKNSSGTVVYSVKSILIIFKLFAC